MAQDILAGLLNFVGYVLMFLLIVYLVKLVWNMFITAGLSKPMATITTISFTALMHMWLTTIVRQLQKVNTSVSLI